MPARVAYGRRNPQNSPPARQRARARDEFTPAAPMANRPSKAGRRGRAHVPPLRSGATGGTVDAFTPPDDEPNSARHGIRRTGAILPPARVGHDDAGRGQAGLCIRIH